MTDPQGPVPGRDYPRTFTEFDAFCGDEAACRDYLRRLRWPHGFVWPRCASLAGAWLTDREYFHCRACEGETTLTAGTIFGGVQ